MPVEGADPLRVLRERIVDLILWFGADGRRLPAAQAVWRRNELWDKRVESEVDRWQVLLDEGRPLPLAALDASPPEGVLFELECLDLLAWLLPGASLAPAPRLARGGREYYVVRLAAERTPHTARQAGLISTHLRYHALVPARIQIDAVRSYGVRLEPPDPRIWSAARWADVHARGHVSVATTSFGDGASIEWREGAAVNVPTARERAAKLEQMIEEAAKGGVDILVVPELTVTPAMRDRVLAALRWASGPELALLVPGSFHEQLGERLVNRALLADGKGNVLCEHLKLVMFGENDGWLESISLGSEVRVVSTPIGTLALAICKDFCDYHVGRVWEEIQAEWLLVPAYGRGAAAHEAAAARVARMVGTIIILAHEGDREEKVDANCFVHASTLAKPPPDQEPKAPKYFEYIVPIGDDSLTS